MCSSRDRRCGCDSTFAAGQDVGPPRRAEAIAAELLNRGIFVKVSSGKSTTQIQVKGLSGKPHRYCVIPLKQLPKKKIKRQTRRFWKGEVAGEGRRPHSFERVRLDEA